ncbi:hypothetical protein [Oenococcus sicerae]|uniref:hypothetical protein n=1 Tax=Oenococcus sicerae TaxID=2203724 RepID=UPI000FF8C451|nr:hypothetical protein [Oenococcus sicerae]
MADGLNLQERNWQQDQSHDIRNYCPRQAMLARLVGLSTLGVLTIVRTNKMKAIHLPVTVTFDKAIFLLLF